MAKKAKTKDKLGEDQNHNIKPEQQPITGVFNAFNPVMPAFRPSVQLEVLKILH